MTKEQEISDAKSDILAFTDFYKAGFIDGFKASRTAGRMSDKRLWEKLKIKCEAAFTKRFLNKVKKGVQNEQDKSNIEDD